MSMDTSNPIISGLHQVSFEIDGRAADVWRLSEGLTALSRLMTATDPQQTDGYTDKPILHGLGYLIEAVGAQFRERAAQIEAGAVAVRAQRPAPLAEAKQ